MTPGRALRTGAGDEVRLGARLGGGGEGEVFEVVRQSDMVAKIYTGAMSRDRARKLAAMTRMAREAPDLLKFCAWPIDTLHWRSPVGGRDGCAGFLMPRISGRKEIHHLTSPPTRKKEFPDKGWSFQIHVAWNLAAAVDTIHAAGVVVGDINERGFLVGLDGTLRVIDCDSFQISHGGQVYRCEVGVADYTPPELQNMPGGFASVVRSVNHDAFGLGIVVFKLLFQGRHPFMGRFSGTGEPDLQRFIREHRFAYSRNAGAKQIAPPPHSLHLGALNPKLAFLFERTFAESADGGGRAAPKEWLA